jgi:hypothetical protein
MTTPVLHQRHRREQGAALFVAVLMLALMGALGIAAMEAVTRDREAAGFYNRNKSAFYAAEAGASHGRSLVRTVTARTDLPGPFPTQGVPRPMGDVALYDRETQLPVYYGDPAFANPIRYVQEGGLYAAGGNLQLKGQKFTNTLWQINVEGMSPDGSTSRVEVMETKILTSGY